MSSISLVGDVMDIATVVMVGAMAMVDVAFAVQIEIAKTIVATADTAVATDPTLWPTLWP